MKGPSLPFPSQKSLPASYAPTYDERAIAAVSAARRHHLEALQHELQRRELQRQFAAKRAQVQAHQHWRAALHCVLRHAAAWLQQHPNHPDAPVVARDLDRVAPGWRERGARHAKR
jgi:hypothetical protein